MDVLFGAGRRDRSCHVSRYRVSPVQGSARVRADAVSAAPNGDGLAWLLDWLADQPGETWQRVFASCARPTRT